MKMIVYRKYLHLEKRVCMLRCIKRFVRTQYIIWKLSRGGVDFRNPWTICIDNDADIKIGSGTVVYGGVHLWGKVRMGKNCILYNHSSAGRSELGDKVRLGTNAFVEDATVGSNTKIYGNTIVVKLVSIGSHCIIGPYALVEQKTSIGDNSHVGAYARITESEIGPDCQLEHVQIKRSKLSRGVTAKHFGYIGDAEIGEYANIGAGTVFCNFDGAKKNPTVIGKNVFIGSGSMLVAPLVIGDGAFIAAGSVVDKDVPPRALAIARGQRHKHIARPSAAKATQDPLFDIDEHPGIHVINEKIDYDPKLKTWSIRKTPY